MLHRKFEAVLGYMRLVSIKHNTEITPQGNNVYNLNIMWLVIVYRNPASFQPDESKPSSDFFLLAVACSSRKEPEMMSIVMDSRTTISCVKPGKSLAGDSCCLQGL